MTPPFEIRYDRRVPDEFLQLFLAHGPLSRLRVIAHEAALPLDLQMRKDPKTGTVWASLYVGLTSVLNVYRKKSGLQFKAHETWSAERKYGFSKSWALVDMGEVEAVWPDIELYLERVIPAAVREHAMTEGVVQTVASKSRSEGWAILDREVMTAFVDDAYRKAALQKCMDPLLKVTAEAATSLAKFPKGPSKFGAKCDLLALDTAGRLVAIEVKPLDVGTIAWVPAQAAMYARVLQTWVNVDAKTATDGVTPRDVVDGMLAQRQRLGHSVGFTAKAADPLLVVPVVVLQRGANPVRKAQMLQVRDLLEERVTDMPPVEIYEVSILGDFARIA